MKTRSSEEGQKLQELANEFWAMAVDSENKAKRSAPKSGEMWAKVTAYETAAQMTEMKAVEADNAALKNQE